MAFRFIAHRGASADAPDNSAQAFELALEQQADAIETDVHLTMDGVLILQHNAEVGERSVASSRLLELRAISPHLLTVAAALVQFGERIPFCWEVKAPGCETALVNLVRDVLPAAMWQQTEFTSFFFGTAVQLVKLAPDVPVGWLTREWDEAAIIRAQQVGLAQICPPAAAVLANPALVAVAAKAGLQVRVWKIESPDMIPDLVKAGVYGGTVNWPAQARSALT